MIYVFLFILGSIVGSFLNVLIYRLPREEKIGLTRSHCPYCKKIIRWYDNIPFFSYILLKAKCRYCGKPISFRYFVVELLTSVIFCLVWWKFGNPILVIIYLIFISLLIASSFIDLDFFIIPDEINLSGVIVGILASSLYPQLMGASIWWQGLLKSIIGLLVGGVSLYIIAITATAILKKEAMGMGDVKLLAMIGSFIGWQWALFTLFCASLLGTVAGIFLIALKKTTIKGKIPFGPYIAMGAVVSLLWGRAIVNWYVKLLW